MFSNLATMRTRFAQEGESEVVDALMSELSFCMQKIKKLEEENKNLARCNFNLYNAKEATQDTNVKLKDELMLQETLVREHRELLAKQQAASPPPKAKDSRDVRALRGELENLIQKRLNDALEIASLKKQVYDRAILAQRLAEYMNKAKDNEDLIQSILDTSKTDRMISEKLIKQNTTISVELEAAEIRVAELEAELSALKKGAARS